MSNSKWRSQRNAATAAGILHAQGGPDRRAEFASRGSDLRDAYDKGFQNEEQDQLRRDQAENHPLRQISSKAYLIRSNPDPEVAELAELIEQMADYLLEKEEAHG